MSDEQDDTLVRSGLLEDDGEQEEAQHTSIQDTRQLGDQSAVATAVPGNYDGVLKHPINIDLSQEVAPQASTHTQHGPNSLAPVQDGAVNDRMRFSGGGLQNSILPLESVVRNCKML
jgi:hypothetical protein